MGIKVYTFLRNELKIDNFHTIFKREVFFITKKNVNKILQYKEFTCHITYKMYK